MKGPRLFHQGPRTKDLALRGNQQDLGIRVILTQDTIAVSFSYLPKKNNDGTPLHTKLAEQK